MSGYYGIPPQFNKTTIVPVNYTTTTTVSNAFIPLNSVNILDDPYYTVPKKAKFKGMTLSDVMSMSEVSWAAFNLSDWNWNTWTFVHSDALEAYRNTFSQGGAAGTGVVTSGYVQSTGAAPTSSGVVYIGTSSGVAGTTGGGGSLSSGSQGIWSVYGS